MLGRDRCVSSPHLPKKTLCIFSSRKRLNDKVSGSPELWRGARRPEKWEDDEQRERKIQKEQVAEVTAAAVNLVLGHGREIRQGCNHRSM